MKEYNSYTYGEAKTGIGQLVTFSCGTEDVEEISKFLEDKVRHVHLPVTHATNVAHGGYGSYSRYEIKQHKYAGGGNGFIEVIEIKNPPQDRQPFIIHEYNSYSGSRFSEWNHIESAKKAWEKCWCRGDNHETFPKFHGFIRYVKCGALQPWFYAVGEEVLIGDYAVASGLEDDPVFRLDRKFVVPEKDGTLAVKTCMGSRFVTEHRDGYGSSGTDVCRYVYFDDGTTLRIEDDNRIPGTDSFPRPICDEETWITEAMEQFRALLSGKKHGFQIKFANGTVFTAKLSHKGKAAPSVEGDYFLKLTFVDQSTKEGWVKDFVPTNKHPNIVSLVQEKYPNASKIKIAKCVPKQGGKKWAGAYFVQNSA